MLPAELRLNKKQRAHDQLVEYANHLQAAITRVGFVGDNLRPSLETLRELSEGMVEFDKKYRSDYVLNERSRVHDLTQLKVHRELQGAG